MTLAHLIASWVWRSGDAISSSSAQLPTESEPIVPGAAPDFLCVGAQKAGTSWLYQQLARHPDFWMPPQKELHYFNELGRIRPKLPPRNQDGRDVHFLEKLARLSEQPWLDLENYGQLFAAKGALLSGDITPAYCMLQDEIIEMIARFFPTLKVIFIARDPIERAWSQLSMGARRGTKFAFNVADPDEVMSRLLHPLVVLRSHQSMIVARWRRHFPAERFRLYFFDDLQTDAADLRRSIIGFLGGDPDKPSRGLRPDHNSDAAEKKLRLSDEVRSLLAKFFAHELKACATELGGAAMRWPARYGL